MEGVHEAITLRSPMKLVGLTKPICRLLEIVLGFRKCLVGLLTVVGICISDYPSI